MNDTDKTKAELIMELQALRQQYNSLQAKYEQKQNEYETAIADLDTVGKMADAKSYEVSQIFANFCHEFRTPLNGVFGFADLLKQGGETNEARKEYLELIIICGESVMNAGNMMLNHYKLAMGLVTIDPTETVINELIKNICSNTVQKAKSKGVDIKYTNPLSFIKSIIKTDSSLLSDIFYILIHYIIVHERLNNGSIELGYSLKKGSTNVVGEPVNPYVLEFFMKINGDWKSNYVQADISDYFNSTTDKNKSWNRYDELSLAKAYVEMLGGKIWLQIEGENRLSFYFTVPYNHDENLYHNLHDIFKPKERMSRQQEEAIIKAAQSLKRLKILLVEGFVVGANLGERLLKTQNHEVIRAKNGAEGVKVFRNSPDIDLILMDIQMPIMDGYEATQQIRKFDKEVIIIALTTEHWVNSWKQAIEVGINGYLRKPINVAELSALLIKYFGK
jgi:CheY-like chemotaxis protein